VFEIVKTASGYATTPTILVTFNGTNGANPAGGLIADASGNLFGTTTQGGANSMGTVFEIAKTASGYATTPTILVSFDGTNGANQQSSLIFDANGNLFGTTAAGGPDSVGTVFEIVKTASGYATTPTILVPLKAFAGTPGKANCYGQSVSALTKQYGGLNNAAAALGYLNVSALQNAIEAYCEA